MSIVKNLIQKRTDEIGGGDALLEDAAYRHNIKGALRDLKLLSSLLGEGYRFDDELAEEHRGAFVRAVDTLETYFVNKLRH